MLPRIIFVFSLINHTTNDADNVKHFIIVSNFFLLFQNTLILKQIEQNKKSLEQPFILLLRRPKNSDILQ